MARKFIEKCKADYYLADVVSATDYYPFGMVMPGRSYVKSGGDYRFGFNGKEDDSEWGTSLIQDYGFRLYNPALGKFLSVDPLSAEFPWNSTYAFAENDVIMNIDLDGAEKLDYKDAIFLGTADDLIVDEFGTLGKGIVIQFTTAMGNKINVALVGLIKKDGDDEYKLFRDDEFAALKTNCFAECFIEGAVRSNNEATSKLLRLMELPKLFNILDLSFAWTIYESSSAMTILKDNYNKIEVNEIGIGSVGAVYTYDEQNGKPILLHVLEVIGKNENDEFIFRSNALHDGHSGDLMIGTLHELQTSVENSELSDLTWYTPKVSSEKAPEDKYKY